LYEKLFEWVPHVEDISPGVRQYTYAPRRPSKHRPMIVRVDSYNRQFVAIGDVGNALSLGVIAVTFSEKNGVRFDSIRRRPRRFRVVDRRARIPHQN
jgi:hypothetical protein